MRKIVVIGLAAVIWNTSLKAQTPFWKGADMPSKLDYPAFEFSVGPDVLKDLLRTAGNNAASGVVVQLPTPEGKTASFRVWRNSLIPEALQQRFPDVWSFTGVSTERGAVSAKIEFSPRGLYAMVYDGAATYFVDPIKNNSLQHKAYYRSDAPIASENVNIACGVPEPLSTLDDADQDEVRIARFAIGTVRRTYRLALSCTGEYAEAVAGVNPSKADVFAAMTTSMNRVNGIYERELAVTMQFITNNDTLVYTDPATDPFTANNNGGALLSQNQSNTNSVIGAPNYDIGHIFSTGAGGIASLGSVCSNNRKSMGVTGRPNPVGDPFDVDYVAHEVGHQFGADHSFNTCSGTESGSNAYEPGGGTTIMAYAGICGTVNNIQQNSDAYFHRVSLSNFNTYLTSRSPGNCPVEDTGYAAPVFTLSSASYDIPVMTPFELDFPEVTPGDPQSELFYGIEQYNRGDFRRNEDLGANFRSGPTLRSFFPDSSTTRIFPRVGVLQQGLVSTKGERLSTVSRSYTFVYIARELHSDGWGSLEASGNGTTVRVDSAAGQFKMLYPDFGDSILRNSTTTIHWDPAHSAAAPVNCSAVDIYLSLDNGLTFPIVLAQNVPNSGMADVIIPDVAATTARVKVKGTDNIFFSFSRTPVVIGDNATSPPSTTNVTELQYNSGINIYPNPARENLYIDLQENAEGGTLVLVNAIGQTVWQGLINRSNAKIEVNTGNFAKGLYLIKYINEKGASLTRKVVIQ